MTTNNEFQEIFIALKNILSRHEKKLVVVTDKEGSYYLDTAHIMKNKNRCILVQLSLRKTM